MKSPDDIWEEIGSLADDEMLHVITKLLSVYDQILKNDPQSVEARNFFQHLDNAVTQTSQCNLNRR
ncbi:MAG: hypothetical protein OEL66_05215 [Desulfobulbaceae bacterium]|nr:hypothetical protein [Desulfobulbaceae bacterium]